MTCQRGSEGAPALHSFSVKPDIQKQGPRLLVPFLLRQETDFFHCHSGWWCQGFHFFGNKQWLCGHRHVQAPPTAAVTVSFISEFLTTACSWWGLSEWLTECRVAERCDHWQEARDDRRLTVGFRTQGTVTWNFPEQSQEGLCKKEPFDLKPDRRVKSCSVWETLSYIGVPVLQQAGSPHPTPTKTQI